MFQDQTIHSFLSSLAARSATPGGGAAAALSCASGAAQACMCATFTTGRKKFQSIESQVQALLSELATAQTTFLALMDQDAAAYDQVLAARRLPEGSEAERTLRQKQVAAAEETGVQVPERILNAAREALMRTEQLAKLCNPNLLADVAVAAWLIEAGARSACLQVCGNLKDCSGSEARVAAAIRARGECQAAARRIAETVVNGMGLPVDTL